MHVMRPKPAWFYGDRHWPQRGYYQRLLFLIFRDMQAAYRPTRRRLLWGKR